MASVNDEDICALVVVLENIQRKMKTQQQVSARNMQNIIHLMMKRRKQRDFTLFCMSLFDRKQIGFGFNRARISVCFGKDR
jgi:hypothetical protein